MNTSIRYIYLLLFSCLFLSAGCQHNKLFHQKADLTENPENIHFNTEDIDLFWEMFDWEHPLYTESEVSQQYINAGSPALSEFYQQQNQSALSLSRHLNAWFDQQYYEDIRPQTQNLQQQKEEVIAAFKKFKSIYPEAVFTDITFVMGALNTGGVVLPSGKIVIAAEMFSRTPDTKIGKFSPWLQQNLQSPQQLPAIILHELVHLQQQQFAKEQNLPVGGETLLDRAVLEGTADFITQLILDRHLNENLLTYGNANERQLWKEFEASMENQDLSGWLYNGNSSRDKPADLGYYIGFKIAQQYYQKSKDKRQAVKDLIEMRSGQEILSKSGYAQLFN